MTEKQKLPKEEKKPEEKIDPRDQKIKELTETLQRLQAEFENYKKRVDKENSDFKRCAKKDLVERMLPFLDSFELALKNRKANDTFTKGIELLYAQFYSILESEGLRKIDSAGKKFDPYKHEALLQEESDKEEGTILEELQKGYLLHDKIIRFAKVKVAKPRQKGDPKSAK
jgi:molecular chaperone GrpE